ncbi:MAG: hypothetical protein ACYTGB_17165 [Planctomycetota bacterium]|jgi:hypothetical protein
MARVWRALRGEFLEHFPFTVLSVAVGLIMLGLLTFVAVLLAPPGGGAGGEHVAAAVHPSFSSAAAVLFHVFHPLHMLFSAIATTAMFWRHERRVFKALLVGAVGSIGICGLSDIILPYTAGLLIGTRVMHLHVCILKHPGMILPFAGLGLVLGLVLPADTHKGTIFSHTAHVWVSSVASIMYLVSFGLTDWVSHLGAVFACVVVAVIVPCCASDIVFPLLFSGGKGEHCACCAEHAGGHAGGHGSQERSEE